MDFRFLGIVYSLKSRATNTIWQDEPSTLWGFHFHQEVPKSLFPKALVIQRECAGYLKSKNIFMTEDAFKPGYGPLINFMWEIRVESDPRKVLKNLGLALSFLALNRFGLSASIHVD
jgi:hypothetical protein